MTDIMAGAPTIVLLVGALLVSIVLGIGVTAHVVARLRRKLDPTAVHAARDWPKYFYRLYLQERWRLNGNVPAAAARLRTEQQRERQKAHLLQQLRRYRLYAEQRNSDW